MDLGLDGIRTAEYTVMVSTLLLTNCVQAHDNMLEVLQHINLYLSMRQPQNIGCPSHAGPDFCNSVFTRTILGRAPSEDHVAAHTTDRTHTSNGASTRKAERRDRRQHNQNSR